MTNELTTIAKRFNYLLPSFLKPLPPATLDLELYGQIDRKYNTLETAKKALNVAPKNAIWSDRPEGVGGFASGQTLLGREQAQHVSLGKAQFFIDKRLKVAGAQRFVPSHVVRDQEVTDAAQMIAEACNKACTDAKSNFNHKLTTWVI